MMLAVIFEKKKIKTKSKIKPLKQTLLHHKLKSLKTNLNREREDSALHHNTRKGRLADLAEETFNMMSKTLKIPRKKLIPIMIGLKIPCNISTQTASSQR